MQDYWPHAYGWVSKFRLSRVGPRPLTPVPPACRGAGPLDLQYIMVRDSNDRDGRNQRGQVSVSLPCRQTHAPTPTTNPQVAPKLFDSTNLLRTRERLNSQARCALRRREIMRRQASGPANHSLRPHHRTRGPLMVHSGGSQCGAFSHTASRAARTWQARRWLRGKAARRGRRRGRRRVEVARHKMRRRRAGMRARRSGGRRR